jgi:hypothetical protein
LNPPSLNVSFLGWQTYFGRTTSTIQLAVAVHFLGQQASIVLPFTVTDHDIGFEIVLGCQWDTWCTQNQGERLIRVLAAVCLTTCFAVPCPLTVIDVPLHVKLHLHKVCSLHGLDVTDCDNVRDLKDPTIVPHC